MIILRCFEAACLALLIIYKVGRVQEYTVLFCNKNPGGLALLINTKLVAYKKR